MSSPESKNNIKEKRGGEGEKADIKNKVHNSTDNEDEQKNIEDNTDEEDDTEESDSQQQDNKPKRLSFLEVLPSPQGTVLATDLANVLTIGMTPQQENVFGNFLTAVASMILYKAASDEIAENLKGK